MRKSPYGWMKTARRGSAYRSYDGKYWIVKMDGSWVLLQMSNQATGRDREVFGKFNTLTAAAEYFKKEVTA